MAHTYVVDSITRLDDAATLTGSVDGVPVVINFSWSSLLTFPTLAAKKTWLAGLALAAAFPPQPIADTTYNGTFTQ